MPIPVLCPTCGHKFNVPDNYAGKKGKCPECSNVFRAPAAGAARAPAEEDIPTGIPLEASPAPGPAFDDPLAQPAPAFLATTGAGAFGATSYGTNPRRTPVKGSAPPNPLIIGAAAGGAVLVVAVVAIVVWASSGGAKKTPVVAAKPEIAAPDDSIEQNPTPLADKPPPIPATPGPVPGVPRKTEEPKTPEKKSGEDLGALPEFEKPEAVVPAPTIPVPPPKPEPKTLSAESIRLLHEECEKLAGKPADQEQFRRFQELARLVTQAKAIEEDASIPAGEQAALADAAQSVLDKLAGTAWPTDAEIGAVNRLAVAGLATEEMGTFAYGTVIGVIPAAVQFGGRNLLIIELGGTMETLVVPVKTTLEETPQGSRWLVLGQQIPGRNLTVNMSVNGVVRSIRPALINATHFVGEPKRE